MLGVKETPMSSGLDLKAIRLALGVRASDLALEAGVTPAAVTEIEQSPRLRPVTADKYFGALGRLGERAKAQRERQRIDALLSAIEGS